MKLSNEIVHSEVEIGLEGDWRAGLSASSFHAGFSSGVVSRESGTQSGVISLIHIIPRQIGLISNQIGCF